MAAAIPIRGNAKAITFTPFAGLMALGERLARELERRSGFSLWDGDGGLNAVLAAKLQELKVPERPVTIGEGGVSLLEVAQHAGFIKTRRRVK